MAYQPKTHVEPLGIAAFLDSVTPPLRQTEARQLVILFQQVTGFAPVVYSGGMVGFGSYTYRYASGHSGVSLATGFAPRKAELSVYIMPGGGDFAPLLARLGPHRMGKGCLYIRRLDAVDEAVLRQVIAAGLADLATHWTVTP